MDSSIKDKELEQLFASAQSVFYDGEAFMARLNRRLDAVEYLKQHEEATICRYRIAMACSLVLGILLGGAIVLLLFSEPAETSLLSFNGADDGLLLSPERFLRFLFCLLLSGITCGCIVCFVNQINDILMLRSLSFKEH